MKPFNFKLTAAMAVVAFLAAFDPAGSAFAATIPIADQPLFTQSAQPPLMMMVMSRDEQLFNKAYDDYSDLDGDGVLDTTYQDRFDYSGYFDPALCYTYGSGQFSASAKATGTVAAGQKYPHQCTGAYSGNFMNWVSMSRLDVLNFVFSGGKRVTPEASNGAVLERAPIPPDLHAWVKVYSGSDIAKFTPYTSTTSFCNATMTSGAAPTIRTAKGAYPEWAATALQMCNWREEVYSAGSGSCSGAAGDNSCYDDPPKSDALNTDAGLTARVQVCTNSDATKRESFCQKYTNSSSGVVAYRPVGLLQTYGEKGQIRFGLLTGSFAKPRSGGVLRRNIGLFAGNPGTKDGEGCAADDEVNLDTGKFCTHSTSGNKGIIATLRALDISGYYSYGSHNWSDCSTYGILNRSGFDGDRYLNDPGTGTNKYNCASWGNPLSEMYAEALRYLSTPSPTSGTPTSTFTGGTDLAGLPTGVTWKDPFRAISSGGNPWCAKCNILVLSTGLNSFDSDEIPTVAALARQAAASTTSVGTDESVSGTYSIGRVASGTPGDLAVGTSTATHTDLCTAKPVSDLSVVRGICPDIPAMEGSYLLDGLAFDAWTKDIRPDLATTTPTGNPVRPDDQKNFVKTFSVALARNLPSFKIPVGSGSISLAPLCQANNSGSGDALGAPISTSTNDKNWRSCFMGSVTIGQKQASSSLSPRYTYGRPLDNGASPKFGTFTFVWEDSLWGNDHDNDVVTLVTYCVGSACTFSTGGRKDLASNSYNGYDICWRAYGTTGTTSTTAGGFGSPGLASATKDPYGTTSPCPSNGKPSVADDEVLIRIENVSAYAGNAMLTGYNIAGSDNDGIKRLTLRPGGTDDTLLNKSVNPKTTWYAPIVRKYKASTAAAKQLENPLFYAAKYGSFNDINGNGKPDSGEWDSQVAGTPDNFFAVTNPSKLKEQLEKVFNQALTDSDPTASTATSTPRFVPGGTLAYQVSYNAKDWTGNVQAKELNDDGTLGDDIWNTNAVLDDAGSRNIFTSKKTSTTFAGTAFTTAGLDSAMQTTVLGTLTSPYNIADLVSFLRGDQSKETPAGPYRQRSSRIGDILNSTPAVQGRTTFGYGRLPKTINGVNTGSDVYQDYVLAKSQTPTVYVGANDGMLHAINGNQGTGGGEELFAYIPNAVLGKLNKLALPTYSHTYFVDGTPLIGDAYDGSDWHTVVLSSTGAGGRAVFALDVSDPTAFGTSDVMWEFNDQIDTDMGTAIVQPSLGLTEDGSWKVAIGNGFNSANNRAVLFVRDLWAADNSGAYTKIDTGVGSAADPNGLATATIVDTDGNGAGDTIYAGDYQGNLWKFVYTSTGWQIGKNAAGVQAPLFAAVDKFGHRQPITSGVYTVANPFGGTMVLFGTGRYLSTNDADPTHLESDGKALVDSIYAIWDAPPTGGDSPCSISPAIPDRAGNLQEQTITANNGSYLASTQTPFDFLCSVDTGKMGWFMDMSFGSGDSDVLKGDRVIASPTVILGTLLVNTFQPVGDICEPGGKNFLMELDSLTGASNFSEVLPPGGGGGAPPPPAGSNTGGTLIGIGPPLGSPLPVVNIPTPPVIGPITCVPGSEDCDPIEYGGGGSNDCKWTLPNPANKRIQTPIPCGRVSWRQLR